MSIYRQRVKAAKTMTDSDLAAAADELARAIATERNAIIRSSLRTRHEIIRAEIRQRGDRALLGNTSV